ncbi:hypothetical protein LCGC14_1923570 [marine sediment metagenome]|uniref:Uncharacterized protein n=1 Tax=marine sediment metagenome TaxID=412755 RepID=A0A0F9GDG2_9ZZZZ|nr:hypothetical protein [Porticoccus sp.]
MRRYNLPLREVITQSGGGAFVVTLAAYTANDVVGGLAKVFYATGGGALLRGVSIRDTAQQDEPYIIHIYRSEPSTIADSAAFAPTVDDADLETGTVTVAATDYVTDPGSTYSKAYVAIPDGNNEIPESSAGTFYVYLQCTTTPDYAAVGDLKVEFNYWTA